MSHLCVMSPLGPLTLREKSAAIVSLDWGRASDAEPSPLLIEAKNQLEAYFHGRLKVFDLPLAPPGTAFQTAVWTLMERIAHGQTRTYGEMALDLKSGPRAVGNAGGRNPIPIFIPCHRVIGAGRRMCGYSGGAGIATKQALLLLEDPEKRGWFERSKS